MSGHKYILLLYSSVSQHILWCTMCVLTIAQFTSSLCNDKKRWSPLSSRNTELFLGSWDDDTDPGIEIHQAN